VAVFVIVGVTVFVGVTVAVEVNVAVFVTVAVNVGVNVGVVVAVNVLVDVTVGVNVDVCVEVLVAVNVGVKVDVCVGVAVSVNVGVGVTVGVAVGPGLLSRQVTLQTSRPTESSSSMRECAPTSQRIDPLMSWRMRKFGRRSCAVIWRRGSNPSSRVAPWMVPAPPRLMAKRRRNAHPFLTDKGRATGRRCFVIGYFFFPVIVFVPPAFTSFWAPVDPPPVVRRSCSSTIFVTITPAASCTVPTETRFTMLSLSATSVPSASSTLLRRYSEYVTRSTTETAAGAGMRTLA
jgi:hypothetical protein